MRSHNAWLITAALSLAALAPASAAFADTIVVTAYDTDGWFFSNTDNSPHINASGDYELGPTAPPLGEGSAQLIVNDSLSSEIFGMTFAPVAASTLTTLSYYTYVTTSTFGSGSAPTLQFDLHNGNTYEGRLVFDPGTLGTVVHGSWQSWDASSLGAWYFSHPGTFGNSCDLLTSTYCTLSQALGHLNGVDIDDVLFKAGSNQSSFNGNVDDFTMNGTTYDFEVPEPGTLGLFLGALALGAGIRRRRRKV